MPIRLTRILHKDKIGQDLNYATHQYTQEKPKKLHFLESLLSETN